MALGANQFLTALELGQLRYLPEFVFINCCYLAKIDAAPRLNQPHKQAASIAQALIEMGVKAVVAAGWAVNDAAGLVFARSFYQSMLEDGLKFGEAVKQARQDTYKLGGNNTWGAYQCYGNPDFALSAQAGAAGRQTRTFYSRRECVDELRDIVAQSTDAPPERRESLTKWVGELDRILIAAWRDGESLSALAVAYQSLENFKVALEAYEEALRDEAASASVKTAEQFSSLQDRYADTLYTTEPDAAKRLWEEAEDRLKKLNGALGESSERLSLLAANSKRRGKATTGEERKTYFQAAADFYQKAYQHTKKTQSIIDPYPGLNAIALSHVAGGKSEIADECLKFATQRKDYPNFWKRVYRPDALLLGYLRAGDLGAHVNEVIQAYKDAFQHATPNERNSALGQLRFLIAAGPADDIAALQRVLDSLP